MLEKKRSNVRFEVFMAVTMKNGVLLCRVALVRTDVSEEPGASFISKSWKPLIGSLKFSGHDPRTLGDTVPHS
jgi:hypothetical protein